MKVKRSKSSWKMSSAVSIPISIVDQKQQYPRSPSNSTKSSSIPPLLQTNPFYDVQNWNGFDNNSRGGKGWSSDSSVSTNFSMEQEFCGNPAIIKEILINRNECFNIMERIKSWNNCLKRKRQNVKKLLKIGEKFGGLNNSFIDETRRAMISNENVQLMCRPYSNHIWKAFEGKGPIRFRGRPLIRHRLQRRL